MSHNYSESDFDQALYPQFTVPSPPRICICCQGKIIKAVYCPCKSCIYCSDECKSKDLSVHGKRCGDIKDAVEYIKPIAYRLQERLMVYGETLKEDYGENLFEFGRAEKERRMCQSFTSSYFIDRMSLISLLVDEGVSRTDGRGNVTANNLALDIAIMQCRHLFVLDKYDSYYSVLDGLNSKKEVLMNLYLFTERYDLLFDLCSFYARNGAKYFSYYTQSYLARISSPNQAFREDITKSFFRNNSLHYESFPSVALSHMYLVKQILHEKMEILRCVNDNLHNHDCISIIGEYIGVKREWIKYEKDWYKKQALEVLRPFVGCKISTAEFGKLYGCSDKFLHLRNFQQMNAIMSIGRTYIESGCDLGGKSPLETLSLETLSLEVQDNSKEKSIPKKESKDPVTIIKILVEDPTGKLEMYKVKSSTLMNKIFKVYAKRNSLTLESLRFMSGGESISPNATVSESKLKENQVVHCIYESNWSDTLRFCIGDHNYICLDYIQPRFEAAVKKLNEIAGYDAISSNFDQFRCLKITRFVTDAMEICDNSLFQFERFIDYMDEEACEEGEMQRFYHRPYDFTYGLMAAMVLERKAAQAFYYISLSNGNARSLLEQLPDGENLRRAFPPPMDHNDPFLTFPLRHFTHTLCPDITDRIKLVCKWLPDVTDVVVSLFNAGLATKPNLSLLFGHSSIVSNTVRDLQLKKMKNSQPSIFSIKPSTWKEGSTVWISELKIHYLTKKERTERFVNASKILFKSSRSIAFFICSTYLIFSISFCFSLSAETSCQKHEPFDI